MQLICEVRHLMLAFGKTQKEMAQEFDMWNKDVLDLFQIEDRDDEGYQKGTGKLSGIAAQRHAVVVLRIGERSFPAAYLL
uniref:Uncharacterized protein n=1 Tax=Anopheles arabiensis TaxID=7173 RepID=A0A182IER2_ANOAR